MGINEAEVTKQSKKIVPLIEPDISPQGNFLKVAPINIAIQTPKAGIS